MKQKCVPEGDGKMRHTYQEAFVNAYLDYIQEDAELEECGTCPDVQEEGIVGDVVKGVATAVPGMVVGQAYGPIAGLATNAAVGSVMNAARQNRQRKFS
jgi:hypothetical protein